MISFYGKTTASLRVCFALLVLAGLFSVPAYAQPTSQKLESAQQSYRYLSNVLSTFKATGRLLNNPGIDGADLEAFVSLLNFSYQDFSKNFSPNSAMCQFYLNPENGRMTLEEKAEIAFSFLPDLEGRVRRYQRVDTEFKQELEREFGRLVLDKIENQKKSAVSNQQLPTAVNGEAAVIAFIDSACV